MQFAKHKKRANFNLKDHLEARSLKIIFSDHDKIIQITSKSDKAADLWCLIVLGYVLLNPEGSIISFA